jgi:HAD superfamily hydrolase (TIGR01509 family)
MALLVFDCDGVLVDSEGIANSECAACLTEAGFPMDAAECRARYLGMTMRDLMDDVAARHGRPLPPGWHESYNRRLAARLDAEITAIDGVEAAIHAVLADGWELAVASSSGHAKIDLNLSRTGLKRYFEGRIFSGQDVARGKPAPDVYLLAARTLGHDPASCTAIEDSPNGVRSARAAGMRVLGYAGETPPAALEALGAEVFGAMHDLPALLGRPGAGSG